MSRCSDKHHIFAPLAKACECGAMGDNGSPRGMTRVRPPSPARHPEDLLEGEVQLTVHWRDALVAGRELANAVEAWAETGNPVAIAAAARMARVAKELEEVGKRGAAAEIQERAARAELVEEGLATS